jgi:undecaprenyl-diphosphatase
LLLVDVTAGGPLSSHDAATVAWLTGHHSVAFNGLLHAASRLGGPSATNVYGSILAALFLVRRRVGTAAAVGVLIYGGAVINAAIKEIVQRGRPVVDDLPVSLTTFSFPSGHAAASTLFVGLLWWIVWTSGWRRSLAAAMLVCAATFVLLVCFSRMYFGLHYPTDVAAGVAEAFLLLSIWILMVDRLGIDLRWRSGAVS